MTKKKTAQSFDEFLSTHQKPRRNCKTCEFDSEDMLQNIIDYVKRKIAGTTDVSWNALARFFEDKYDYPLTSHSLINHSKRCLGDLSRQLTGRGVDGNQKK